MSPESAPRPLDRRGEVFAPIPRVLHQTWKSHDLPEAWQGCRDSWRRHHPGWRFRLWTDDDNRRLIADHHPAFLATYDAFPRPIQRVDAAKYFILYTHGGVYADLDCECLKPVEALIEGGGAVVGRTRDRVIEGAFFASPPGHPLWRQTFREMRQPPLLPRLCRAVGYRAAYVLFSTGPRMLKRAVRKYLARCREAGAPGLTIWGPQHVADRSWLERYEPYRGPQAFLCHHYSDSWLTPGEAAVHRYFNVKTLRIAAVTAAILGLIAVVAKRGT